MSHSQDAAFAKRAHSLFLRALEQPSEQRTDFLLQATVDEPELFDEVQSLFSSQRESRDFLAQPALPVGTGHPDHIGPYEIQRVLGEGGMGVVYLAEQTSPVQRQVALKIIKLGMDTRRVQSRFQLERQALAIMNHPGIAHVFEVGTTQRGQAYFAMEYVDGLPITEFAIKYELNLGQRLKLMRAVCNAVQHAHQKGILHRDLKPSNILVTMEADGPQPHVIDFGVARALHANDDLNCTFTEGGAVVGTPDYMSPEQAGVGELDVDTRADVYSLGIVLYELVVGRRPYEFGSGSTPGLLEAQKRLHNNAPPPPKPSKYLPRISPELEWILLAAISHDRHKRYGSPSELADDLRRFERREPVLVGPPARTYQWRKFVQRNVQLVIAGSLILTSLIVGLGIASFAWRESTIAKAKSDRMLGNYRSVADDFRLAELQEEAQLLWPIWPNRVPAMQDWLNNVEDLFQRLPDHQKEFAGASIFDELEEQEWLNRRRDQLVHRLREVHGGAGAGITLADMQRRIDQAQLLQRQSQTDIAHRWKAAINQIADIKRNPQYRGLRIQPQMGLIPLLQNPQSRLWEFLVWGTGEPPEWSAEGWKLTPETGVIMVLLPGGEAWIGVNRDVDPDAPGLEGPRHKVELEPFFLSKYELSQGQWARIEATTSLNQPEPFQPPSKALLPQAYYHWLENRDMLARLGLEIPTESQWEYAARAGNDGRWVSEEHELADYANLRDLSAKRAKVIYGRVFADFDDGSPVESPIGTYKPNAFGLHDVHGNLYEFCQNTLQAYEDGWGAINLEGPLLTLNTPDLNRVVRGGSFIVLPFGTRFSLRVGQQSLRRSPHSGSRPARRIY